MVSWQDSPKRTSAQAEKGPSTMLRIKKQCTIIRQTRNASRKVADLRLALCIILAGLQLRYDGFMGRFKSPVK